MNVGCSRQGKAVVAGAVYVVSGDHGRRLRPRSVLANAGQQRSVLRPAVSLNHDPAGGRTCLSAELKLPRTPYAMLGYRQAAQTSSMRTASRPLVVMSTPSCGAACARSRADVPHTG